MIENERLLRASLALIVALLAVLLTGLGLKAGRGLAEGEAVVSIYPPSQEALEGVPFTVSVRIEDATNLYGAQFQAHFNPAVLEVQDVDSDREGVQIEPGPFLSPDFVVQDVANITGTIDYAVTQMAPTEPVTGSGVLATIVFKGLITGTSPITLEDVTLSDPAGYEISATHQDGQVTVMPAHHIFLPLVTKG